MEDQRTRDHTARQGATAAGTKTRVAPSSSRMLASYMSDIEQLLDERIELRTSPIRIIVAIACRPHAEESDRIHEISDPRRT